MSEPVVYAVFSKDSEISLYWQCVCLAYFVEGAVMVADGWRLHGAAAIVRLITMSEARGITRWTTMRWSDIPGARFDEHEEEGEE